MCNTGISNDPADWLAYDIIHNIFRILSDKGIINFDNDYSWFYKAASEASVKAYNKFADRFIKDIAGEITSSLYLHELFLEGLKKPELTHKEKIIYCKGYNDAVAEHEEFLKRLSKIIDFNVRKVLGKEQKK